MRLGLIARRDWTGLGVQTKAYYKHLKPFKTMVVDISSLNGNKQNADWYSNEMVVQGFPTRYHMVDFLRGLDVVLFAETPYNYELITLARKMNIKTINVVNWEFFDYLKYPDKPLPDVIVMPSVWHYQDALDFAKKHGIEATYIHHPVDREEIPFQLRKNRIPFHIAGKPAVFDRNGTWDYLEAIPNGRLATQDESFAQQIRKRYPKSRVMTNIEKYHQLYYIGDILVFPRKYGGNCLPLNEALSSGMPVIMPDIEPNNYLLPKHWLVEAHKVSEFTPRTTIDIYQVKNLADKILETEQWNMTEESNRANMIADSISWEFLLDDWRKICEL